MTGYSQSNLPQNFLPKSWKTIAEERMKIRSRCRRIKHAPLFTCTSLQPDLGDAFHMTYVSVPPALKSIIGGVKVELSSPICIEGFSTILLIIKFKIGVATLNRHYRHGPNFNVAYYWNIKHCDDSETLMPPPFRVTPHTKSLTGDIQIPIKNNEKRNRRQTPTKWEKARANSKSNILVLFIL